MTTSRKKSNVLVVLKCATTQSIPLALLMTAAIIGAVIFALLPPLVLERMINELVDSKPVGLRLIVCYFGALVLSGVFDAGREVVITKYGQRVTHALRTAMCQKLGRLPAHYFIQNEAGKITSKVMNDVDTVEGLFSNSIISMVADALTVIGIFVVLLTKSIGLAVIIGCLFPLLFLLTRRFQQWMLAAQLDQRIAIARLNNYIPETLSNRRMIRSFYIFDYMEKQYAKANDQSYRAMEKTNRYDSIYSPIIIVISTCVTAVVMVMAAHGGGMEAFFGISVGTAVAIIAYIGQVFGPIESIGMEIQNIQSAIAGVKRIDAFLNEKERPEVNTAWRFRNLVQQNGACIVVDQVDFGYTKEHILEGVSLTVKTGEIVTLTGRTGCGKSTLFRLILGLYQPDSGQVKIYGEDASTIPDCEKRKIFGYVAQTFHPIPGTIAEQITLFDQTITMEKCISAATLVGLHDIIMALPKGYDTPFNKSGFSQGQEQLLSIARAVVGNPAILLLDEITANLDTITEALVMTALKRAAEGRTVVSISHRLYGDGDNRIIHME